MARLMGRSVVDLAGEVDSALGVLAQARGLEAVARETLDMALNDVSKAERGVREARDAMFKEHPDLAPKGWNERTTVNTHHRIPLPDEAVANPAAFDSMVEEVDDENDPRFTGGVSVSTNDNDPLPPIEFEEHDE